MTQSKDERLVELSKATVDAKIFGTGLLCIFADNSFSHVPIEAVQIDVSKLTDKTMSVSWRSWGDVFNHYKSKGLDPADAAYHADEWEKCRKAGSEPVAWLKEWETDGEKRRRVDLTPDLEPWLRDRSPKVTPLYPLTSANDTDNGDS